jgi:hypothetical protein
VPTEDLCGSQLVTSLLRPYRRVPFGLNVAGDDEGLVTATEPVVAVEVTVLLDDAPALEVVDGVEVVDL